MWGLKIVTFVIFVVISAMLSRVEIFAILHPDPWFSRQAASLRTALVSEAQVIPVEAGHWIYDAGEDASGLYGVLTGSVSIYIGMEDETAALVNIVGPGHIFGYTGRFLSGRRVATAVAREPGMLFYLPERGLEAIARKLPDLWIRLAELSSFHVVSGFRLAVVNTRPAASRLASHLLQLAAQFAPSLSLPVTQDELAEITGLSRKTVNRVLASFEARGFLHTGYRTLEIADEKGLRQCVRAKAEGGA